MNDLVVLVPLGVLVVLTAYWSIGAVILTPTWPTRGADGADDEGQP